MSQRPEEGTAAADDGSGVAAGVVVGVPSWWLLIFRPSAQEAIDLQKGANFKSVWMVSRMTTSVCFSLCTDLVASGGGAHRRGVTFLE